MFTWSRRWRWRLASSQFLRWGLFVALAVAGPSRAYAFPELVRYGYGNCISCHYSPTGGGILTEYGRQLSREVLSTWGNEGEGNFVFGTPPKWLALGGDIRTLNLRTEAPGGILRDQLILMQGDLEGAATYKQFSLVGTFGRLDTAIYPEGSDWISRRFYLLYKPTDELTFRAGRFMRAYGINTADHFTVVKSGLGWDQGTESINLEGAWLGDTYNFILTGNLGRPDHPELERDQGVVATASVFLAEKYKVGLSYYYGSNDLARRNVFGPWGILGFTKSFFLLTELDFQRNFGYDFDEAQWGLANYSKLDFEPVQGLHVFGTAEWQRLNFSNSNTGINRYGVGMQWFPRPHWDFEAEWQDQRQAAVSPDYLEILWLMIHYYL